MLHFHYSCALLKYISTMVTSIFYKKKKNNLEMSLEKDFLKTTVVLCWWNSTFGWRLRGPTASIGVRPWGPAGILDFTDPQYNIFHLGWCHRLPWTWEIHLLIAFKTLQEDPCDLSLTLTSAFPVRPTMHLDDNLMCPDQPAQSFHLSASGGLHPLCLSSGLWYQSRQTAGLL